MNNYDIIIKPVLSEKSYDGIAAKRYAFVVKKDANKTQIKLAIESIFGVSVDKVNTVRVSGKTRRRGYQEGKTASYKKAYVTLTADSKAIEFFESLS
ncbi:MAG: 50S ribosomal protein L23 [Clostridia bacterium]|nr:50S ribosomal protein L23 [Clostridia bacterium]